MKEKNGSKDHLSESPDANVRLQDALRRCECAEEALEKSRDRLKTLLETIYQGISENDISGTITYGNAAHHRMLGYEPGELVGVKIWDLLTSREEKEKLKAYLASLLEEEPPPVPYIAKSLRKDGRAIDIRVDWNYLRDDKGRVSGFISLITDQTEHMEALEKLVESEKRFRTIVEAVPMGMHLYECDPKGRLTFTGANPAADDILGVDNSLFIGKTIEEAFPPLIETEVPTHYRKICCEGTSWHTEQITYEDEQIKGAFEVHAFQTAPGRMAAMFLDITGRKKAEEDLRESEERFRTIFENAMDGIALADAETKRLLAMNEKFVSMLGYDGKELRELGVGDIHPSADLPHVIEQFERQYRGEITVAENIPVLKKDGSVFYADISSSPLTLQGRSLLLGIFRDITERSEAEREKAQLQAQVRQVQKMEAMGTLAGGIAHDFNNILAAMLGYTELALLKESGGESVRTDLEDISTTVFRARDLVSQILTFSRPQEQISRPVDIHHEVGEALKLVKVSLPGTVVLRHRSDPSCGTVLADPTHIQQVLMNLASNAVDAMGGKGELGVALEKTAAPPGAEIQTSGGAKDSPFARLSVRDTGKGMGRETTERIFEPFFTTKDVGKGTGMGLSVVHGIVKSQGGQVTVDSTPGEGAVFHVYLPLVEGEMERVDDEKASPPGGSERIFLVDDEETLLVVIRELLRSLGYEVSVSSSGEEALERFRLHPDRFDLVITDQVMPSMTGMDLARDLLRIRPDLPIILCTGFSSMVSADEAFAAGIGDFLMKPVSRNSLARSIRKLLDEKKSPRRS